MTTPRVVVCQAGARHNYALPAAFSDAGMLEAFYTDMCAGRGLARIAQVGVRLPIGGSFKELFKRLSSRVPPPAVLEKTRTDDLETLRYELARALAGSVTARERAWDAHAARRVHRPRTAADLGNATHLFTIFGQGGELLTRAKERGLPIFSDVIIALSAGEIVRREVEAYPDWGISPPVERVVRRDGRTHTTWLLEMTDVFVCPSEFVAEDLVNNYGVSHSRVRIVPYALSEFWFDVQNDPVPGRVLFVGSADLRKGIQYVAKAASILKERRRQYDIRVAGGVSKLVQQKPECMTLRFLGRVPRTEVGREFSKADIFVLPSVAEGSATVTYEALAAGLPCVVTKAAGSQVRDGVDGVVIPERDPEALADAVERIVEDRSLRALMSQAARENGRKWNWARYRQDVVELVKKTPSPIQCDI